jgi:hypothetical protein
LRQEDDPRVLRSQRIRSQRPGFSYPFPITTNRQPMDDPFFSEWRFRAELISPHIVFFMRRTIEFPNASWPHLHSALGLARSAVALFNLQYFVHLFSGNPTPSSPTRRRLHAFLTFGMALSLLCLPRGSMACIRRRAMRSAVAEAASLPCHCALIGRLLLDHPQMVGSS